MKNCIFQLFLAAAIIGIAPPSAQALSSDRDQPAQITADDIEFDFNTGVRTYTGNVSIVQGTLRIKADKLVAHYDSGGALQNATAWGNLASFQQRPDDKDNDTIGKGREIFVDQVANTLTLITTASLTQGPNTATGARIIYDMATDRLKIQGGGGSASINTAGKDGSTAPPPPVTPDPAPAPTGGEEPADGGECADGGCEEAVIAASIPGIDVAVSPTGRSRVIIQPKSNPAPATTARAEAAVDAAEEKVEEAIESGEIDTDKVEAKIDQAVESLGGADAGTEEPGDQ